MFSLPFGLMRYSFRIVSICRSFVFFLENLLSPFFFICTVVSLCYVTTSLPMYSYTMDCFCHTHTIFLLPYGLSAPSLCLLYQQLIRWTEWLMNPFNQMTLHKFATPLVPWDFFILHTLTMVWMPYLMLALKGTSYTNINHAVRWH